MRIHIFWDNSNIFARCQGTAEKREPDMPRRAVRVYWPNLYKLIGKERDTGIKVMAGSVPPQCDDLWPYARSLGFDVKLLTRVRNPKGSLKEQGVDDLLHLRMANAVLDAEQAETMILLSGDGNASDSGNSFVLQLERAMKKGWNVEHYAWRSGFSRRFDRLSEQFPKLYKKILLDDYYESITFLQDGRYKFDGGFVTIEGRIVSPLPAVALEA